MSCLNDTKSKNFLTSVDSCQENNFINSLETRWLEQIDKVAIFMVLIYLPFANLILIRIIC